MPDEHAKQLKTLGSLRQEVKDAKRYLKEQNELVEITISDLNSQLIEFNTEIRAIQEEKNKLSADIIHLEQEKAVLEREVKKVEDDLENLDIVYQDKVAQYRSNLIEMNQKNSATTLST